MVIRAKGSSPIVEGWGSRLLVRGTLLVVEVSGVVVSRSSLKAWVRGVHQEGVTCLTVRL